MDTFLIAMMSQQYFFLNSQNTCSKRALYKHIDFVILMFIYDLIELNINENDWRNPDEKKFK